MQQDACWRRSQPHLFCCAEREGPIHLLWPSQGVFPLLVAVPSLLYLQLSPEPHHLESTISFLSRSTPHGMARRGGVARRAHPYRCNYTKEKEEEDADILQAARTINSVASVTYTCCAAVAIVTRVHEDWVDATRYKHKSLQERHDIAGKATCCGGSTVWYPASEVGAYLVAQPVSGAHRRVM